MNRKKYRRLFISLCVAAAVIFALLAALDSPYLGWDYDNPGTTVAGTLFHIFEWSFVRLSPFILIGSLIGIFLARKPT